MAGARKSRGRTTSKQKLSVSQNPRTGQSDSLFSLADGGRVELTDDEKADVFMSKFNKYVNPHTLYRDYLNNYANGMETALRLLKMFYKKMVLEKGWSERKFVNIIDVIWTNNYSFTEESLLKAGRIYDNSTGGGY